MSTEVLTNLDLNQHAVQEFVLESLATAPLTPVIGQEYFDTTLGFARTWNGTTWTANVSAVNKFAATIGDGIALVYTVTHNLNTRDVVVGIYDATTFAEVVGAVVNSTVNTVTVTFLVPPALGAYRVVVLG